MAVEILRNVIGRQLGLDKDDNLVLGGFKLIIGHNTKQDIVVDLSAVAGVIGGGGITNVVGNGTTDNLAALNSWAGSLGTTPTNAQIQGIVRVAGAFSFPSSVNLSFAPGAQILADGAAVNLGSYVNATTANGQIFATANGGSFTGPIGNGFAYPEWFGAKPGGTAAANAVAIQAASKVCNQTQNVVYGIGTYAVDTQQFANGQNSATFEGANHVGTDMRLTIVDGSTITAGNAVFKTRGAGGRLTNGYMRNMTLLGGGTQVGVMHQGMGGFNYDSIFFDGFVEAAMLHNEESGAFTEYVTFTNCQWRGTCSTGLRFKVTSGNNSFHGSGLTAGRGQNVANNSGSGPFWQVDDGARPYGCPFNLSYFVQTASTQTLTFTGALTAASGTAPALTSNWTGYTGKYLVTFSSGERRTVTLTKGATTTTFDSALVFPATSAATVENVMINNANTVSTPHVFDIFGKIDIENSQVLVLGASNTILGPNMPISVSGATNGTGANVLGGTFMRCKTASGHPDGSYSWTGAETNTYYTGQQLTQPMKLGSPLMFGTHRLARVEVNGPNYSKRFLLGLDNTGSGISVTPQVIETGYALDSGALGALGAFTGNTDGSFNLVPGVLAQTFSGLPSGTSQNLNANWTLPTGTYPIVFSDGQVRNAVLTTSQPTCDWSADARGAITGTPTTAVNVTRLSAVSLSIYVNEVQSSSGLQGGGHCLF